MKPEDLTYDQIRKGDLDQAAKQFMDILHDRYKNTTNK